MHYTVIAIGLLSTSVIVLTIWVILLEKKISTLLSGNSATSLEHIILKNQEDIESFKEFQDNMRIELNKLDLRMQKKLHGVVLKRFNPFQNTGTGGNHSFAAAFLDEHGNGAVISSLYTREKVSMYAKPVTGRESDIELTEEERCVIEKE